MRYGICIDTDISALSMLKEYGYDYAEFSLSNVAKFTDEQIAEARAEMDKTGIYAECCNGFFSLPDGYLTDGNADYSALEEYMRRALGNAAKLGTKVAVVGSGKARKVFDESRLEQGKKEFAKVLRMAGDIAEDFDIKIVIEPLRVFETNVVNTVADGIEMLNMANHPNVFVLADFYHVYMSGESLDAIRNCGKLLQHVHIARSNKDRMMPLNPEDIPACKEWAAALKENGYDIRMSLEGYWGDNFYETAKKMRDVLHLFD